MSSGFNIGGEISLDTAKAQRELDNFLKNAERNMRRAQSQFGLQSQQTFQPGPTMASQGPFSTLPSKLAAGIFGQEFIREVSAWQRRNRGAALNWVDPIDRALAQGPTLPRREDYQVLSREVRQLSTHFLSESQRAQLSPQERGYINIPISSFQGSVGRAQRAAGGLRSDLFFGSRIEPSRAFQAFPMSEAAKESAKLAQTMGELTTGIREILGPPSQRGIPLPLSQTSPLSRARYSNIYGSPTPGLEREIKALLAAESMRRTFGLSPTTQSQDPSRSRLQHERFLKEQSELTRSQTEARQELDELILTIERINRDLRHPAAGGLRGALRGQSAPPNRPFFQPGQFGDISPVEWQQFNEAREAMVRAHREDVRSRRGWGRPNAFGILRSPLGPETASPFASNIFPSTGAIPLAPERVISALGGMSGVFGGRRVQMPQRNMFQQFGFMLRESGKELRDFRKNVNDTGFELTKTAEVGLAISSILRPIAPGLSGAFMSAAFSSFSSNIGPLPAILTGVTTAAATAARNLRLLTVSMISLAKAAKDLNAFTGEYRVQNLNLIESYTRLKVTLGLFAQEALAPMMNSLTDILDNIDRESLRELVDMFGELGQALMNLGKMVVPFVNLQLELWEQSMKQLGNQRSPFGFTYNQLAYLFNLGGSPDESDAFRRISGFRSSMVDVQNLGQQIQVAAASTTIQEEQLAELRGINNGVRDMNNRGAGIPDRAASLMESLGNLIGLE